MKVESSKFIYVVLQILHPYGYGFEEFVSAHKSLKSAKHDVKNFMSTTTLDTNSEKDWVKTSDRSERIFYFRNGHPIYCYIIRKVEVE